MPDNEAPESAATVDSAAPEATVTTTAGATVPDKHAEIRAKLNAAKAAEAAPVTEKPADTAPATTTATPTTDSVSAVMEMTAARDQALSQLTEVKAQLAKLSGPGTIEELRARVRRDPGVLLDVFGEDISPEAEKRLDRLNEVALQRDTPEWKAKQVEDERIAKLEAELAAERGTRQSAEARERDARARGHVEEALTKGMKDGETVLVDPTKYPYVNHLAKSGELDVYEGIMLAVRELSVDFKAKQKRLPTDAEIGQFIANCSEKAEAHFAKLAKLYQLPAAPVAAPEVKRPRTIGAGMGNGGTAAAQPKPQSKDEAHAAIRERLKKQTANAPN